ncbi:MAG TPA: hypothetical protein VM784_00060, partial [Actinomycetota bacterium]|nr:hypothetical protein [Actinomycetota bacterium]
MGTFGSGTRSERHHLLIVLLMVSLLTGLLVGITSAPLQAKKGQRSRLFVMTRDVKGPSHLVIQSRANAPVNGREFIAAIPLTADRRGKVKSTERGVLFASEGGAYPEAYAFGDTVTCSDTGNPEQACQRAEVGGGRTTAMSFEYDGGKDDPTHVLVMIQGTKPLVRLDEANRGWSIIEVKR